MPSSDLHPHLQKKHIPEIFFRKTTVFQLHFPPTRITLTGTEPPSIKQVYYKGIRSGQVPGSVLLVAGYTPRVDENKISVADVEKNVSFCN